MIEAVFAGDAKEVGRLIREKADVNAQDAEGNSPLHVAVREWQLNVAKKLTESNELNLNALNGEGRTAYDLAVEHGRKDMSQLLESRVQAKFLPAILRKQEEVARQLLDPLNKARPDVNSLDQRGTPVLHHVVKSGSGELLRLMLVEGTLLVNRRDRQGKTALDISEWSSDYAASALKAKGGLLGSQVESEEAQARDVILETFNRWDTNKNSSIEEEELGRLFAALGMTNQEILHKTYTDLDMNKDGKVDYREFVSWVFSTEAPSAITEAGKANSLPLSPHEELAAREGLLAMFSKYDLDQSGSVEESELDRLLCALGMTDDLEALHETFKSADIDQDGRVDYKELIQWLFDPTTGGSSGASSPGDHPADLSERKAREGILAAFKRYDADQSGFIEEGELKALLGALGMSESDVHATFEAADFDHDGKIGYQEFVQWLFSPESSRKQQPS